MKQSLQERCEAQIRNETAMRKVAKIEHEAVLKLCAMMHVNAGCEVNPERMKECNSILKSRAGLFSNFRGTLQRVVVEKTRETYTKLKEKHPFLTDESDMSLIALMIMAGKNPEQAAEEAEGLFQTMKKD